MTSPESSDRTPSPAALALLATLAAGCGGPSSHRTECTVEEEDMITDTLDWVVTHEEAIEEKLLEIRPETTVTAEEVSDALKFSRIKCANLPKEGDDLILAETSGDSIYLNVAVPFNPNAAIAYAESGWDMDPTDPTLADPRYVLTYAAALLEDLNDPSNMDEKVEEVSSQGLTLEQKYDQLARTSPAAAFGAAAGLVALDELEQGE